DQVIFDRGEVTKPDGSPYTVFTPFAKKWKATLAETPHLACPNPNPAKQMYYYRQEPRQILSLEDIGFYKTDCQFVPPTLDVSLIARYDQTRDFPALQGTTRIGMALRFGTISVRACVSEALETNEIWLNELIWREFFMQILYHFPQVEKQAFKPAYDHIRWRDDEVDFGRWCEGQTGYPLVDAGMRELNATGFMHNRVRMVAASFLCKHLLIDWRWGEAYFA